MNRQPRPLFLLLAVVTAALAAPPAGAAPRAADKRLVGVWHASPAMGSGWNDVYQLFADGTFRFHASQMDGETRERRRSGTWRADGKRLFLRVTERVVLKGGRLEPALGSTATANELVGAKPVVEKVAGARPIVLPMTPPRRDPRNGRWTVRLGTRPFWKFDDDPKRYP